MLGGRCLRVRREGGVQSRERSRGRRGCALEGGLAQRRGGATKARWGRWETHGTGRQAASGTLTWRARRDARHWRSQWHPSAGARVAHGIFTRLHGEHVTRCLIQCVPVRSGESRLDVSLRFCLLTFDRRLFLSSRRVRRKKKKLGARVSAPAELGGYAFLRRFRFDPPVLEGSPGA